MATPTPTDIRINFDTTLLQGDFVFDIENQDLETESGIVTAVIISWLTDRRADDEDILPDPSSTDKRGWWGDEISDVENDRIGSKLWLLSREKTLDSVLQRAKEYGTEALEWMLEDDIVKSVFVESERQGTPGNDRLALRATIETLEGSIYTVEIPIAIPA